MIRDTLGDLLHMFASMLSRVLHFLGDHQHHSS